MTGGKQKPYQRLPGTGYRQLVPTWVIILLFFVIGIFVLLLRGRRAQLWLGENHLLSVEWDGRREYYKRFRYADIQSFTIRKTAHGAVGNGILGLFTVLFALFAITASDPVARGILLGSVGVFALLLIGNCVAGPTCQCHLNSAVQTEELPSLARLPRAQKALGRLRPLITSAQGLLAPDEMSVKLREIAGARIEPEPEETTPIPFSAPNPFDDPSAPPRTVS